MPPRLPKRIARVRPDVIRLDIPLGTAWQIKESARLLRIALTRVEHIATYWDEGDDALNDTAWSILSDARRQIRKTTL